MAVSIDFSWVFATLLTFFVVPVVYPPVDSLFGAPKLISFKDYRKYNQYVAED